MRVESDHRFLIQHRPSSMFFILSQLIFFVKAHKEDDSILAIHTPAGHDTFVSCGRQLCGVDEFILHRAA